VIEHASAGGQVGESGVADALKAQRQTSGTVHDRKHCREMDGFGQRTGPGATSPQNSISVCQSRPLRAKTRRLDREHSADTAVADRCEQPLKAGTRDAATRAAEICVDDIDVAPGKLLGAIDEAVLAPPALMIVLELICCRLPDVDAATAREMLSRDLGHGRSSRLLPCWLKSELIWATTTGGRMLKR
jgi:hypothetical protein